MPVHHGPKMRLLSLLCHLGQIEDARVDFKFVDKLTLLMHEFFLEVALLWIIEFLRAEQETT